MEWTVVTVIVVLVGLIAAVVKPLLSLNTTITRLTESVNSLENRITGLSEENEKAHDKLWTKSAAMDERINNHETRLQVIENK